ncbi:MAG: hypothetical protein M1814_003257 [Vezdaea aestivalis]|nr:MAG: hypothetical protein M1814_003257 [Vezdaea aestivalis]
MPHDEETHDGERTALLSALYDRRLSRIQQGLAAESILSASFSKEEQALAGTSVGERLGYNDYTTIDWLHDLVKDSFRYRAVGANGGIRGKLARYWDSSQGWVAAALIGVITAGVAFLVDIAVATVSDWKHGYCSRNPFISREVCCLDNRPFGSDVPSAQAACPEWHMWRTDYSSQYGIYVGWALLYGIIASSLTMLTKASLPAAQSDSSRKHDMVTGEQEVVGKTMYLAAGSGIPEIKTILSGFVIPHILDFKVLVVKAVGAVFAVSTGMCLGKEGPFVHISTCVGWLVSKNFPKYHENGRKMREMLSAACSSGLSVAFGAPIGGVLFSYEEISTYFPRRTLWKAFLCSMLAAVTLKALNPTGTGKLVLFETNYGTSYKAVHYLLFVVLGIAGGVWGGTFCKLNFLWSKTFRKFDIIKTNPVFEVFLVTLATALLQFPSPMTREPGDTIIKEMLVSCQVGDTAYVCRHEMSDGTDKVYIGWLIYGTLIKLLLTIITFGIKVPSGIIIPALDAGAFFGRLLGQGFPEISPGVFAMVGAAAFLAGVSRMTLSLAVIMFELTGELEYVLPNMIAILIAKWVADALEKEGIYDLAQTVLGHPFLDLEHSINIVKKTPTLVEELIPPEHTMREITVDLGPDGTVQRHILETKLEQLKRRGLMDAGLVLVRKGMLAGYLAEAEIEFGLDNLGDGGAGAEETVLLVPAGDEEALRFEEEGNGFRMDMFVDRTPLTISEHAPMEYLVEMFGKLGLRYLCVLEEGSGKLVGVVLKKRLILWMEGLKD